MSGLRSRRLAASLFVVTAVLFAIGVSSEGIAVLAAAVALGHAVAAGAAGASLRQR